MTVCFPQARPSPDSRREFECELVSRVRSGNQDAFRELVEQYQAKVFSIIYRILRNRQDAEDTAQVVFFKVYFALKDFDSRCLLLSWICKIAINECYTHLRRRRVRMAFEERTLEMEPIVASRQPSADSTTAHRDLLNKLLARVPEDDRMLLVLKEMEGHSIAELSQMTGASENAIKVRLFRARQKLIQVAESLSQRPAPAVAHQ
jgi:RNA polymerase sigma-70 factor (ECF subfamily)